MAFSAADLQQFDEQGYVICHSFFNDKEVAAMQAELARLVADGLLRNVATEGDGTTHSTTQFNLQICPLAPHSEVFRALPFCTKVRTAVHELLRADFLIHLDQIFLKPAGHGAGTGWHQDDNYFRTGIPTAGTGMWIAVHDAMVENGTMHIVPGVHEIARPHTRDLGSDHHVTCLVDENQDTVIPVEMKAGSALFFNFGVPHCTKGNTTENDRAGLALHFLKESFRDQAGARLKNRPSLWGPDYDAGLAEYGTSQDGAWEQVTS
ncbi:MAG TPA: hypothetical protein DCR55_02655 [Lentisphaeria bacterium]|nr:hypothetical protein [Lentisphaeria bacterium]